MHEAFVNINGVPTHLQTWGRWIEETFPPNESLILCIPGNPGITGYYTNFLETIYTYFGGNVPVWIIGHAGHEKPPNTSLRELPPLNNNEVLYNLRGQVEHKAAFIRRYIPENVKVYIISHSIGSYITLELLQQPDLKSRIVQSYLLFPTVEQMAATPNGVFFTKIIKHITWIIVLLAWIFTCLPQFIQTLLMKISFYFQSIPNEFLKPSFELVTASSLSKVFFMAKDEMNNVLELDGNVIEANKNCLRFYYGAHDKWAPASYCRSLRLRYPGVKAEICRHNYKHAFVLQSSKEMGTMVATWIKNDIESTET